MIAFFDSSALSYLIEGAEPLAGKVRAQVAEIARRVPDLASAVSRLTWMECRVAPLRAHDQERLADFDAFFARHDIVWIELTPLVVELATEIRARHGLSPCHALQAASCLQLGDDHLFLTGDHGYGKVAGLHLSLLN